MALGAESVVMDKSRLRELPRFFVVGAQKAGTTSVHGWLARHPTVRLPHVKETHFFSSAEKYARGIEWYVDQFGRYEQGAITGEVAPQYMYSTEAPLRIRQWIGSPRFIFLLRHPIERAFSNYLMTVRQGHESLPFSEALIAENERLETGSAFARDHYGYMARGRYSVQIARYREHFPDSSFHFALFDELINTGEAGRAALTLIARFIGVTSAAPIAMEKENPASAPRSQLLRDILYKPHPLKKPIRWLIPSRDLRESISYFVDRLNQAPVDQPMGAVPAKTIEETFREIDALEKMLGTNLSEWRTRTAKIARQ
jgi:hypothetical protein